MVDPLKLVDAHIHLSDEEYEGNVDSVIKESKKCNVVAVVTNSMDLKTSQESLKLAEQYPGFVYAALGIHPWTVKTLGEAEVQQTSDLILDQQGNKKAVAIGEIGLDHKYMPIWDKQAEVFDEMLRLAEKLNLPAIIHSRGTTTTILDMLPSYNVRRVLLHWFSNPISALSKVFERGYFISEGVPTIYSKGIRDVVKKAPLTNLLTETDGPVRFFKPPINGAKTTPALIRNVVQAIAEIKRTEMMTVCHQIGHNFEEFFQLKLDEVHPN